MRQLLPQRRVCCTLSGKCSSAPVRRHPLAPIEAPIFLGRPIPLVAPGLEVGLGPVRQKYSPCRFEVGASLVEACCCAIDIFSRVAAWIEPAHPAPGIFMGRNTGADCDGANAHVTVIDV